jgi:hypothetical protein
MALHWSSSGKTRLNFSSMPSVMRSAFGTSRPFRTVTTVSSGSMSMAWFAKLSTAVNANRTPAASPERQSSAECPLRGS